MYICNVYLQTIQKYKLMFCRNLQNILAFMSNIFSQGLNFDDFTKYRLYDNKRIDQQPKVVPLIALNNVLSNTHY